jgi:hypothetical protein
MSLRLSSSQSSHFVSLWGGVGIPGSEVPLTGDNGGSPLANDGISPTAEYRIETVTAPSAGALDVYPDTSYEFSGAPDGTYPWMYRVFEDSVDRGTATEYLVVGSPVASFAVTTQLPVFSGSASVADASPETSFAVTTALPVFSGSAYVSAVTAFAVTTALPVFSGSATTGDAAFAITASTQLPAFAGGAHVSPVAVIATTTMLPTFYGSASGSATGATFARAPAGSGPLIIIPGTVRPAMLGGTRH